MKIDKQIISQYGEFLLRSYNENDLIFHAEYMYASPHEFITGIGFDPNKFPPKALWESRGKERLSQETEKNALPTTLAVESKGATIAIVVLDRRNADGIARIHFHIFDPTLRCKGLGKVFLSMGINTYWELYGINKFMIEPSATNAAMNGLMRKMGFRHIKDYIHTPGPLTKELLVSQYEVIAPV